MGTVVRLRTTRRFCVVVAMLATAMMTITGCSGVPDRTDLAADITTELRNLPGVDHVVGDYLNGLTTGQSYNVRVQFTDDVTADEVNTVVKQYFSRIADPALDDHSSRLDAQMGTNSMTFASDRSRSESPVAHFQRWYTLTKTLPGGSINWWLSSDGSISLIKYNTEDDLNAVVTQLRAAAPDLQRQVRWIIRTRQTRLGMYGRYLDVPAARLAAEFASTNRRWSVENDTRVDPELQMAVRKTDAEELEPTARADLRQIAALNVPVQYTLEDGAGPHLEVFVGGCQPAGTGLQQQLNAEFGTC